MYRCYLLRDGRIVKAENLDVATLDQAIAAGRRLLADQPRDRIFSGIEIWHGTTMLYADTHGQGGDGTSGHNDVGFGRGASMTPAQQ
jgi:hypothetical protein